MLRLGATFSPRQSAAKSSADARLKPHDGEGEEWYLDEARIKIKISAAKSSADARLYEKPRRRVLVVRNCAVLS